MASNTLYPPVVNNTEPAFVNTSGELKVYFKFSALNSDLDKSNISVHATVHLKVGTSIVNPLDGNIDDGTMSGTYRLRATQIILNLKPEPVSNSDLWYIILKNEDIYRRNSSGVLSDGWYPGDVYKIQIRLSSTSCSGPDDILAQQAWLYANADSFSEWSTVIYTKCISDGEVKSYCQYEFDDDSLQSIAYPQNFEGAVVFSRESNEHYESCLLKLFKLDVGQEETTLIEEVVLYPGDISRDNFKHLFRYNFQPGEFFQIEFSFVTENKYQSDIYRIIFVIPETPSQICDYKLNSVDISNHPLIKKVQDNNIYYASLGEENDNGCVGLKLELDPQHQYDYSNINLRIVRSDEYSNFTIWEEIKYINLKLKFDEQSPTQDEVEEKLKYVAMFFDYTIESNVFYKYGIQSYLENSGSENWTLIKAIEKPIQRDFEYSYLVGKDQKQLNIKFNNAINSFTPQVYDNKLEPIGSQFPYIYRNSKIDYRTFPISGTISFEMDDNDTFLTQGSLDIYGYSEIKELHKNDWVFGKYNYGYERKFRKKVIDFLKDGSFKLFKSASEGDIIVRLKDINCTPNQQLNRLIYNFSANADEVDTYELNNLKKYGIIYPGTYVTNWDNVSYTPAPNPEEDSKSYNLPHSHSTMTSFITPNFNTPLPQQNQEEEEENQEEEG